MLDWKKGDILYCEEYKCFDVFDSVEFGSCVKSSLHVLDSGQCLALSTDMYADANNLRRATKDEKGRFYEIIGKMKSILNEY